MVAAGAANRGGLEFNGALPIRDPRGRMAGLAASRHAPRTSDLSGLLWIAGPDGLEVTLGRHLRLSRVTFDGYSPAPPSWGPTSWNEMTGHGDCFFRACQLLMGMRTRVVQEASSRWRRGVGSRTKSQPHRAATCSAPTKGGLYREAATASVSPSKAARLLAKLSTTIRLGSSFAGAWGGRCQQGRCCAPRSRSRARHKL